MSDLPVSVLVPSVGRRALLEACLSSVLACRRGPDEIVVVDQSPGDEIAEVLARLGDPRLRRVASSGRGTAHAMNVGLAEVRHDTVLTTHDDCTVDVGWVAVARRLAAGSPSALLTGRVLAPRNAAYVPSTKDDPTPHDYTGEVRTGLLYPSNMVVSRRAAQALGGFDERASLRVSEDNDFCYRWLVSGRPFRYEPEMVVWHHDWRDEQELVRTHVAYARGQGAFYGKYLWARDRRVLPMLRWDLREGVRRAVRGRLDGTPRWQDPYRETLPHLPAGIAAGWWEAREIDRRQAR